MDIDQTYARAGKIYRCGIESEEASVRWCEFQIRQFDFGGDGKSFGSVTPVVSDRVKVRISRGKPFAKKPFRMNGGLLEANDVGGRRRDSVEHLVAASVAPIQVVRCNTD
ncbi:hypothetical protein GCM10023156_71030 [Novipirellula rosea]|uniref:Uncharacterized protein n=1 Tax=Novipirellula rosea TaxID=1031540 RepID=A0ABP8NTX0_9BACT